MKIVNRSVLPSVTPKGRKPHSGFEINMGMKLGSTYISKREGDFTFITDGLTSIFARVVPVDPVEINVWNSGNVIGGDVRVSILDSSFMYSIGVGIVDDSARSRYPYYLMSFGSWMEDIFFYLAGYYLKPKVYTDFRYQGQDTSYTLNLSDEGRAVGLVLGFDYNFSKKGGFTSEAQYTKFAEGVKDFYVDEYGEIRFKEVPIEDIKVVLGMYWRLR